MIQLETPFPHPGSIAEHDGQRCRVMQLLPGNRALLSIIDTGRYCRTDLTALTDPRAIEDAVIEALVNPSENDKRRALWIGRHLRDINEVAILDLEGDMRRAAQAGRVSTCNDRRHLVGLLRKLGWTYHRPRQKYVRAPLAGAA